MNRDLLANAAPKWIKIESFSAQTKHRLLAMWIGAVIDAIEADHAEPDTWEAMHLAYALQALVEAKYYAALTFSEMVLIDPAQHRPARLQPGGPEPVKLSDLRRALQLLVVRKPREL